MNKAELLSLIADKVGLSKRATEQVVESVFNEIVNALENGEEVKLTGFGTFTVRDRAERRGVNPQDGRQILIPAGKTLVFRPSKLLKDKINK